MERNLDENELEDFELESENDLDEEESLEEIESSTNDKMKKLRVKLKLCETEKMTALEDQQRAKADFLNARRRLDEEKVRDRERLSVKFVEEILPVCDSFEMALKDPSFETAPDNLQKGVSGINLQLNSILKSYDVETLGTVGEKFDPNLHEAVANEVVEEDERNNTVVTVVQKGYRMKDMIIRPARVTVGIKS